jgi:hypothetical protein
MNFISPKTTANVASPISKKSTIDKTKEAQTYLLSQEKTINTQKKQDGLLQYIEKCHFLVKSPNEYIKTLSKIEKLLTENPGILRDNEGVDSALLTIDVIRLCHIFNNSNADSAATAIKVKDISINLLQIVRNNNIHEKVTAALDKLTEFTSERKNAIAIE